MLQNTFYYNYSDSADYNIFNIPFWWLGTPIKQGFLVFFINLEERVVLILICVQSTSISVQKIQMSLMIGTKRTYLPVQTDVTTIRKR